MLKLTESIGAVWRVLRVRGTSQMSRSRRMMSGAKGTAPRVSQCLEQRLMLTMVYDSGFTVAGPSLSNAYEIEVDAAGNQYVVGDFKGETQFDPGGLTPAIASAGNGRDLFVAKYDVSGGLTWVRTFDVEAGSMGTEAAKLGVSADGQNVWLGQSFSETAKVGSTLMTAAGTTMDFFLAHLDGDGNLKGVAQRGGALGNDYLTGISTDSGGNAVVSSWGQWAGQPRQGNWLARFSLASFDNTSQQHWLTEVSGRFQRYQGTAIDANGNVYVGGQFDGAADFDPGAGSAMLGSKSARYQGFILKLTENGQFVWARAYTGGHAEIRGISVTGSGQVVLAGEATGKVDFDPGRGSLTLMDYGSTDIFVTALKADGTLNWARRSGGTSVDSVYGLTIDADGSSYVTGLFSGTADFDPGAGRFSLTSLSTRDTYIQTLDANGSFVWAGAMSGTAMEAPSIAASGQNSVFVVGSFQGTADLNPATIAVANFTSTGSSDAFVVKLVRQSSVSGAFNLTKTQQASKSLAFTAGSEGESTAGRRMDVTQPRDAIASARKKVLRAVNDTGTAGKTHTLDRSSILPLMSPALIDSVFSRPNDGHLDLLPVLSTGRS